MTPAVRLKKPGREYPVEESYAFTRQTGLEVPDGVRTVIVQGRDQEHGYGGRTLEVDLPGR